MPTQLPLPCHAMNTTVKFLTTQSLCNRRRIPRLRHQKTPLKVLLLHSLSVARQMKVHHLFGEMRGDRGLRGTVLGHLDGGAVAFG